MTVFALLSGLGHTVLVMAGLLVYVLATRIGHQRRNPSAAVAWVIAMVTLPYLTLPLFLLIGTRKVVRPLRRARGLPTRLTTLMPVALNEVRSDAADAVATALAVASTTGPAWATQLLACMELPPAVHNSTIVWHADGPMALQGLMRTIDSATRSLDVCTFVFGDDAIGNQVAQALLRAVQRQVAVRLLVDAVGSLHASASTMRSLEDGGVLVQRFMPLFRNPMQGHTNLRNHRKLVVADQHQLWTGGRNLAVEYFLDRPGHPAWIDLSYEVCGPLAVQAATHFGLDWAAASGVTAGAAHALQHVVLPLRQRQNQNQDQDQDDGQHVATSAVFLPNPSDPSDPADPVNSAHPVDGPLAQWVPSGPDYADDTVYTLLLAGAYHAQQRIVAVTPYFVPDDALVDAWCLACRRGVQVTLLLPQRSNHRLADWARERALRALAAAGAQIWLVPSMVHAKAVLIDDDFALSGSLNLDARSLFLNYEVMTAFYAADDLRWLYRWCDKQIAHAMPYQARKAGWARDVAEGVVRTVGFQL